MARNKQLYLVKVDGKKSNVHLRSDDSLVAVIYFQQRDKAYRFSLMNYRQSLSRPLQSIDSCLTAIEKEVL